VAATCPVQRFETFLSGPRRKIGPIQRFVYHIDKGLCIVRKKATYCVTLIFVREDCLDQGGEFVQSEPAPDQTPAVWGVEVGSEERIRE
jgi:hypothetical protein